MTETTEGPRALVVPGGRGGPYVPLLEYAGDAAELRNATVARMWWTRTDPARSVPIPTAERAAWTAVDLAPAFAEHRPDLVIAKSLGTYAAPFAAEAGAAAVWLTPILADDRGDEEYVIGALRRATAPFLLVGGTADRSWNSGLARELTPYVHEVPEANHGLYVPGPLSASLDALAGVVAAVERFLDEVVWP